MSHPFFDIAVKTIDGRETTLAEFKGNVILVVNVASQCGYTPQYAGLESLYQKYKDQGFVILGFPCNQFLGQEPGDESAIQGFCHRNFGVTFHLFSKINVNGSATHPLFEYLKSQRRGIFGTRSIKWNFTKFLISRSGEVTARYGPSTKPESLEKDIQTLF